MKIFLTAQSAQNWKIHVENLAQEPSVFFLCAVLLCAISCSDSKNILISLYIVKTFSFVKDGLIKQQQNISPRKSYLKNDLYSLHDGMVVYF